jgi:hypothetical protein
MKIVVLSLIMALIAGACCKDRYLDGEVVYKEVIKKDTLILIPAAKLDTLTLINVHRQTDTFTVTKERLKVQVVRVNDTHTVRVPVEVQKITYLPAKEKPTSGVGWWAFAAGLLLAGGVWAAGKWLF